MHVKKNILLVTLHFDQVHAPIRRRFKLPQGMGAVFLAGAFSEKTCNIKVYSELYSGPLEDINLLSWADMVVLTGVTNCFDRMLHITAYAKTCNPRIIIVAGGPAVRAFPRYSSRFFDYCCLGDMEQLQDVVSDAFGLSYVAENMEPRLDLAHWIGMHGHVETSRYCQFKCSFCSLTGEKVKYQKYSLEYIRRQFERMGKRRTVHFIDNNFYGNDREFFLEKLDLIKEYQQKGFFKYWSALVSGEYFENEKNIEIAKNSGCVALFSGVESFDKDSLKKFNKHHNLVVPQFTMIERTLNHGMAFWYGLFTDVYTRSLKEIHYELESIIGNHKVTLPGFISLPIPIPGTPFFKKCMEDKRFLPNTMIRHLDGTTLCMEPYDSIEDVTLFIRSLKNLKGYRRKIATHAIRFTKQYRKTMDAEAVFYSIASNILLTMNTLSTAFSLRRYNSATHVSSTEVPETTYTPKINLENKYATYFKPTFLTNQLGDINPELLPDLEAEAAPYYLKTPLSTKMASCCELKKLME